MDSPSKPVGALVSAAAGLLVLLTPLSVFACASCEDTPTPIFDVRPDVDAASLEAFSRGQLGVVQPGWMGRHLAFAYLVLTGYRPSTREAEAIAQTWKATYETSSAAEEVHRELERWEKERNAALGLKEAKPCAFLPERPEQETFTVQRLGIGADAFRFGRELLEQRRKLWGGQRALLAKWVEQQERAWGLSCPSVPEAPALELEKLPPRARQLFEADRKYQDAAAKLYAGDTDGARASFLEIAQDTSSPYRLWGEFLAARASFRAWRDSGGEATARWEEARGGVERVLASDSVPSEINMAAENLRVRLLSQREQQDELCRRFGVRHGTALSTLLPLADEPLAQDVSNCSAAWRDFEAWRAALANLKETPTRLGGSHSWRERRTTPWLIASLWAAERGAQPANPELLSAAESISEKDPAYPTVRLLLVRLLERSDSAKARSVLATTAPSAALSPSARYLFQGERAHLSKTVDEWLALGVAPAVGFDVCMGFSVARPLDAETAKAKLSFLHRSHAASWNDWISTADQLDILELESVPKALRPRFAITAFVRSAISEDVELIRRAAAILAREQPALASELTKVSGATNPEEVKIESWLWLTRKAGVSPWVSTTFIPPSEVTWSSWSDPWCSRGAPPEETSPEAVVPRSSAPLFLKPDQRARGELERKQRLDRLEGSVDYLGAKALALAQQRPQDERVPELLHLIVKRSRWGCSRAELKASQKAFRLLHRQYPQSKWAQQTRHYY